MSTTRTRSRSYQPPTSALSLVVKKKSRLEQAMVEFEAALLAANEAGWSLRKIGEQVGLDASTVYRAVVRAEKRT